MLLSSEFLPTWLEEHREAEVDDLERRVLRFVREQEVLRLEVSVHHPVLVAQLHATCIDSCTTPSDVDG